MIDRKALTGQAVPRSTTYRHRRGFIPIRDEMTDSLLFYYDPIRDIIEIQRRGRKQIIDLTQYREMDESEADEKGRLST